MIDRDNDDLDEAFGVASFTRDIEKVKRKKTRKKRVQKFSKDFVRRMAFRVLAQLSKLDAPARRRVLDQAIKINEA